MSNKLELLPPADPASEKKLAAIKKTIAVSENGIKRSGAQMFGYAHIQGAALIEAKEIVPHGNFQTWVEQNFPEIGERTARYRMGFAEEIRAKTATVADLPTGGKRLLLGNGKKISRQDEATILKVVPDLMDGQGMIEFMRAAKFQRETEEKGGYRPNNEELQAWLKEKHPDLAGKSFEELPNKIQMEFQEHSLGKSRRMTPEEAKEHTNELADSLQKELVAALGGKWLMLVEQGKRDDLALVMERLQAKLKSFNKPTAQQ